MDLASLINSRSIIFSFAVSTKKSFITFLAWPSGPPYKRIKISFLLGRKSENLRQGKSDSTNALILPFPIFSFQFHLIFDYVGIARCSTIVGVANVEMRNWPSEKRRMASQLKLFVARFG